MTNTNERATAQVFSTSEYRTTQVFGLSLTAIFAGLLILNGIFFLKRAGAETRQCPFLPFFAVVGSVLFALLFVADATLEQSGSPVIVTSQRTGPASAPV
jgi:hypothetical protein